MFIVKFDLMKAFDTLNLDSLIHRLEAKGFPHVFIRWVKVCIYSVFFFIMLNGEICGYFHSKNSLRQGCPLSPLLFMIAMDSLCLLDQEINHHRYVPYYAGTFYISH